MSRIGQKPIAVPKEVRVEIDGNVVTVMGPRGQLSRALHPDMSIALADSVLTVARPSDNRPHRSLHGLTRSLLANMVEGVSDGFRKNLDLSGVGYRAQMSGNKLVLQVGFRHPVEIVPPDEITFNVGAPNQIAVSGINKELVGEIAARIRAVRPPNRYTGKGIRYAGEQVQRKAGKAGKIGAKKR